MMFLVSNRGGCVLTDPNGFGIQRKPDSHMAGNFARDVKSLPHNLD